ADGEEAGRRRKVSRAGGTTAGGRPGRGAGGAMAGRRRAAWFAGDAAVRGMEVVHRSRSWSVTTSAGKEGTSDLTAAGASGGTETWEMSGCTRRTTCSA